MFNYIYSLSNSLEISIDNVSITVKFCEAAIGETGIPTELTDYLILFIGPLMYLITQLYYIYLIIQRSTAYFSILRQVN